MTNVISANSGVHNFSRPAKSHPSGSNEQRLQQNLFKPGLEGFERDSKYRGKIQVNTALGKTGFSHLIPT